MFILIALSHENFTCVLRIRVFYFTSIFLFMIPRDTRQSYRPDVRRDSRRLRQSVGIWSRSSYPNKNDKYVYSCGCYQLWIYKQKNKFNNLAKILIFG